MNTFTPQSSYSYEEIIECGKGNLFGKGNAQLPAPPMLMFDRITNVNKDGGVHGKGEITAELDKTTLVLINIGCPKGNKDNIAPKQAVNFFISKFSFY